MNYYVTYLDLGRRGWWDMWHWERSREIHIGIWYENLSVWEHLENLGVEGMKILKWAFKK
jgi:hypothetical protein